MREIVEDVSNDPDIPLDDRVKAIRTAMSIDQLYYDKGATAFEDLGKDGTSYTYYEPSLDVHKIVINERFMGKDHLIIPSSHHEHGHVLFTVTPDDVIGSKIKKWFYNLTEDIRLEAIIAAFFPNMKGMFNRLHQDIILVSGRPAGDRIKDMIHLIFGIRLFQHTELISIQSRHSDPEIEKITTLLLESIDLYYKEIKKYWSSFDTQEIIKKITENKKASEKYAKAVMLGFRLIDEELAKQTAQQQRDDKKDSGEGSEEDEEETEDLSGDAGADNSVDDDEDDDETEGSSSGGDDSEEEGDDKSDPGEKDGDDSKEASDSKDESEPSQGSNDADQQDNSPDKHSCFHEGTDVVKLEKLAEALTKKLQEAMEVFDKTTEDEEIFDVETHIREITRYCGACGKRSKLGSHGSCKVSEVAGGHRAVLPHKLAKVLADKRKIVAVERSNMRMGSAPLTGHGKKYIDLKRQSAHFEFELCFDVSQSVNSRIMDREYKIGQTLFETFKHMAEIKVSSFSSDYSVISRGVKKFPREMVIRCSIINRVTNLFEALKTATREYTDKKKVYVFICITDGEAGIPSYMNYGMSPRIAQIYLKQLQKRNVYVILLPVNPLSLQYTSLYGRYYVKADDIDVNDKFSLQKMVDRFGDLIFELWEEKAK